MTPKRIRPLVTAPFWRISDHNMRCTLFVEQDSWKAQFSGFSSVVLPYFMVVSAKGAVSGKTA